ncbi:MAG TPA: NAD(P)/FAD-dependent oxidoreductase [Solirubrobacteraceae bacterium]|jgi:2-polyprenyl-6-methoxyphenol hydroxylase-like FAD-dependent oxidoreductase
MADSAQAGSIFAGASDYDVAVAGASLAGCTTAILLAKAGARVALVEQRPDANAFKRICTHYIQSSAVPTLERMGLLERMMQAGAVRGRARLWTRWGWIDPPARSTVPSGVNLRREKLDPMIRQLAAETPGVDLILGHTVQELVREGGTVCGLKARNSQGETLTLRARLVVGADGRDSRVAKLAEVSTKTVRHGRFAYGGYFEGPPPVTAPDPALWLLDPHMAAAFPTDSGLIFYAVMPTKDRLPEFRADPEAALKAFVSAVPEAPPILASRLFGEVTGKIDMTNVIHKPTAPGLALTGDAAGALDPLWGVGCGFAFQSSEWLADSVAPALTGAESLEQGLERYRRRHARGLRGHTMTILDYSSGRKLNPGERMLFSAATYDERTARVFEAFGSRNIGPVRMLATGVPLAVVAQARHSISRRRDNRSSRAGLESA